MTAALEKNHRVISAPIDSPNRRTTRIKTSFGSALEAKYQFLVHSLEQRKITTWSFITDLPDGRVQHINNSHIRSAYKPWTEPSYPEQSNRSGYQ